MPVTVIVSPPAAPPDVGVTEATVVAWAVPVNVNAALKLPDGEIVLAQPAPLHTPAYAPEAEFMVPPALVSVTPVSYTHLTLPTKRIV